MLESIGAKNKLSEATLREVRRILGPDVCPFLASGNAVVIGFIAAETAMDTGKRIREVVGSHVRISVLELGQDQAQWGLPHHNDWIAKLRWMSAPPSSHQP